MMSTFKHLKADNIKTICGVDFADLNYSHHECVEIPEDANCTKCVAGVVGDTPTQSTPTPTDLGKILAALRTRIIHDSTCKKNDCYQVDSSDPHFGITIEQATQAIQAEIDNKVERLKIDLKLEYATQLSILDQEITSLKAEIVKARINELERQEFQDVMMLYAEYETREVVKNRIAELSNKEQNYDPRTTSPC